MPKGRLAMADSAIAGMGLIGDLADAARRRLVAARNRGAGVTSGLAEAYTVYGEIASPGSLPASAAIAPLAEAAFWPVFAAWR